jgi:uncharacterized membrane protein (DUF4010 family)
MGDPDLKKPSRTWIKTAITLGALALLTWLAPVAPLDPWNLVAPQKIASMIFALALIQAFGSIMGHALGARTGAVLTGFFGGLVSSTATTASLAKRSKGGSETTIAAELLVFLSATCAMLFEGLALVLTGLSELHASLVVIFIGPIFATLAMIFVQYRQLKDRSEATDSADFQILSILKLALFILAILSISKISQNLFGQNGLLVLTSLVSLFEIHGSVIANVQLHESGTVSVHFLASLLAVSIVASYLSKIFLISTLGSSALSSRAIQSTLILIGSLAISWAAALSIN